MKALGLVAVLLMIGSCGYHDRVDVEGWQVVSMSCAKARDQIEVKAYYFSAPEGFTFAEGQDKPAISGTYTEEVGAHLVKSLSRRAGFGAPRKTPLVGRQDVDKPLDLSVSREFIYPSEYAPPVLGKAGDGGICPVTPATPVAFEKRDIGVFLKTTCRSAEGGKLKVKLDFSRTVFMGFINYGEPITAKTKGAFGREVEVVLAENRIEMPVFERGAVNAEILVNDGDFIAVSGFLPMDRSDEKMRLEAVEPREPEFAGKNFVALIQVGRAR